MDTLDVKGPAADWTDKEWDNFTKWMKDILRTELVTVTFTKKDGTERIMKCTLDPKVLPPAPIVEGAEKKERKVNENIISVYDVESQGWRSFTIKSVKKVEFTIG